jgi:hypothetical protein
VQLLGPGALGGPLGGVERAGPAQVPAGRRRLDRHRQQPGQRQAGVERGQAHDGQPDDQRGGHHLGDGRACGLGHGVHVAGHPGDQVAGAAPLDVRQRHAERPVDDPVPQGDEQQLAEAADERRAQTAEQSLGEGGDEQADGQPVEVAARPALVHHVDDLAEQARHGEPGGGGGDEDGERGGGQPAMGPGQRGEHGARLGRAGDRQHRRGRGGRGRRRAHVRTAAA